MNKTNKNLIILSLEILIILAFGAISFVATKANAYCGEQDYVRLHSYSELSNNSVIISIKPNSINEIKEKLTITVNGDCFTQDSVVRKNNSNRPTTFIDSKHLLVNIYPDEIPANQSEFFLTVFNRDSGEYSNAVVFTIQNNVNKTRVANPRIIRNNYSTYNNPPISNYNSSADSVALSKIKEIGKEIAESDNNESLGSLTANALYGSNSFMPSGLAQWIFFVILIIVIISLWRYIHRSEEKYMATPIKHA